jgi:hypothetical protein
MIRPYIIYVYIPFRIDVNSFWLENMNFWRATENDATFIPEPLTVPGQNTALAKLHEIGQGAQFDTIPFSGSSLSLHNRAGQNFSVSYSVAGNLVDATGIPN